jgi:hypothetical protein
MSFLINVVIAVATLWNAVEDWRKAWSEFRSTTGAEKAKNGRKFVLLWLVPILSIIALPFTWQESTTSERKISEARERAGNSERLAAELNLRATSNELARVGLEKQVELIRKEKLELEAQLSPRVLWWQGRADERLQKFTGTKAVIIVSPCSDCYQIALQITGILSASGWHVERTNTFKHVEQGITIDVCSTNTDGWRIPLRKDMIAEAADALADELNQQNINSIRHHVLTTLRFDGVLILVGARPVGLDAQILRARYDADRAWKQIFLFPAPPDFQNPAAIKQWIDHHEKAQAESQKAAAHHQAIQAQLDKLYRQQTPRIFLVDPTSDLVP